MSILFFKALLALLSLKGKLSVLNYHQVLPVHDPMRPDEITALQFDRQMSWIASCFNTMTMAEGAERIRERALPPRALVITFDDGYENNHSVALPILLKYKLKSTFFIASDFLDGGIMWNDRVIEAFRRLDGETIDLSWLGLGEIKLDSMETRQKTAYQVLERIKHFSTKDRDQAVERISTSLSVPDTLMLRSQQLSNLAAAGMEIGGHTRSHPILTNLGRDQVREEIEGNKQCLERLTGTPLVSFAYPNGKPGLDYDSDVLSAVRTAGYLQAVTTSAGVAEYGCDYYQIPRFTPWRRDATGFLGQMALNYLKSPEYC